MWPTYKELPRRKQISAEQVSFVSLTQLEKKHKPEFVVFSTSCKLYVRFSCTSNAFTK